MVSLGIHSGFRGRELENHYKNKRPTNNREAATKTTKVFVEFLVFYSGLRGQELETTVNTKKNQNNTLP